jgi:hypothetical protein
VVSPEERGVRGFGVSARCGADDTDDESPPESAMAIPGA